MRPAPQPFSSELCEPTLDEVEPTRIGRREVQREARVTYEPALDRRRLVGRGVIDDDVHVELGWYRLVDEVQESTELLGAVARRGVGDHVARCDVQSGVEIGGAVALVVVRAPLRRTGQQWKNRR